MALQTVSTNGDVKSVIMARVKRKPGHVWTPADFADIGNRELVDKALQRLTRAKALRRIDRGLYDMPRSNELTGTWTVPDYRAVIDAVTRRDSARTVIDGMTAANDLGLTTAVPAKIEVMVDARLKTIRLGNQEIVFKHAAPSRLYWAGRPGMRVVQALHWLKDVLDQPKERRRVAGVLRDLFQHPKHGRAIANDLRQGLSALPIWMQDYLRDLIPSARRAA
jgi:predicted transcriptional regulator of viral defense system